MEAMCWLMAKSMGLTGFLTMMATGAVSTGIQERPIMRKNGREVQAKALFKYYDGRNGNI